MNTTNPIVKLEKEIAALQKELLAVGPMHPGSLSKQYQVCGRAGCRCADPEKPVRHGPYVKLSYVYQGKPVCRFVRAACVSALSGRLAAYKRFRRLTDRWVKLSIQKGCLEFFDSTPGKPTEGRAGKRSVRPRPGDEKRGRRRAGGEP